MRPRWMRNHLSCPDCGHVFTDADPEAQCVNPKVPFDCTKCGCHYAHEDFWKEHDLKVGAKPFIRGSRS